MAACTDQAGVAPQRAVALSELTPHLVCPLCGGYYVDATAIVECLHTFCRSCILLHLHTTRRCPVEGCDVLVQKAQGASAANLRPDATLQSIVYKTVPGLHRDEMQRRRLFYADNLDNGEAAGTPSGPKATEEDQGSAFYDASDIIDLLIQYAPQRPGDVVPVRYLRCPAGTPLSVLSKFLRRKYQLSEDLRVELLCDSRRLPGDIKLLDVLYMVNWDRESPVQLVFRLHRSGPVFKSSVDVLSEQSSSEVRKTNTKSASASCDPEANGTGARQKVQTKLVAKKDVPISNDKKAESAHESQIIPGGPCDVEKSTRPAGACSLGSLGCAKEKANHRNTYSPATVRPVSCGRSEVEPPSTARDENIDKSRKRKSASLTEAGKDEADDSTAKPNKRAKLSADDRKQTSAGKLQAKSLSQTHKRDSAAASPLKRVATEPASPKKDRKPQSASTSKTGEPHKKESHTLGNERVTKEHTVSEKRSGSTVQDSNGNTLKPKEEHRQQSSVGKEIPRHSISDKKEQIKLPEAFVAIHKHQPHQQKIKDATCKQASADLALSKGAGYGAKSSAPVKTKRDEGNAHKTTSHGTNTFLSSSPQTKKAQTSVSSHQARKDTRPTAPTENRADGTTEVKSSKPTSQKPANETSVAGEQKPASKTIFLFSGMKKSQSNNRIMSIVESLAQKSLLSSRTRNESVSTDSNRPGKQTDAANSTACPTSTTTTKAQAVTSSVMFVAPSSVPVRSAAMTPVRPVSSPLHIETATLGLRYGSAVPPLSSLSRPAPSTTTTSSTSSRPVFPVPPLPQRPKSQNVRAIPNPSLLRQRSAEERARDSGKGSPTAGSTAPAMSPPTIRDIHSLTRQLQEAGTSVTVTSASR